jgi:predicted MFS family arabinose efflux permease
MTKTDSRTGRAVLMTSHCAGMVDMVALPLWVGTLIAGYRFDPQQAGGLVTLFLLGVVVASLVFAPRFDRYRGRRAATLGFGIAAAAFVAASRTGDFTTLALLHGAAGFATGIGLSFTHGTIGRSANPHRLFGLAGMVLGIFSVFFLGGVPQAVAAWGAPVLFTILGGVMALACVLAAWGFPQAEAAPAASAATRLSGARMPRAVWFGIVGISCMALVQAMMFSFVERMGADRGFGADRVTAVLVAVGVVAMFPPVAAALLERRLPASAVVLAGAAAQALAAVVIAQSEAFAPYAVGAALLVSVMLFTHTFAFGLLARLDPSGRAVAATPAMLMIGSCIGPLLGGTLVKTQGYAGLGVAALLIDALALAMFLQMNRHASRTAAVAQPA